jgi:HJR/Mrr/RecB family endonuclease
MFEKIACKLFERMGYRVFQTSPSHDYGADMFLKFHGFKAVVQVKCQKKNVGVTAIQQVVAAKQHYGCQNALVVISSHFTKQAKELAFSNFVELWDKEKLAEMIIRGPCSKYG